MACSISSLGAMFSHLFFVPTYSNTHIQALTNYIVIRCLCFLLDKWITFPVKTPAQLQCCFRFSLERFISATWARVAVFIHAWLHGDQLLCHYTAWKITVLCHTSSLLCRIISFITGKQARGAWRSSVWRCVLWKHACVRPPPSLYY